MGDDNEWSLDAGFDSGESYEDAPYIMRDDELDNANVDEEYVAEVEELMERVEGTSRGRECSRLAWKKTTCGKIWHGTKK